MGSSWKVAYADFVTAMMAFFLLMWLVNAAPKETLQGLAGMFQAEATLGTNITSPLTTANNPMVQYVDKLDTREFKLNEAEKSQYAIAQLLKDFLMADAVPSSSSGISSDNVGVLLHITSDVMFQPNSEDLSPEGERVLDQVLQVMYKYKVFLIVRGHADSSETGAPKFPSKWELSSARANSAVRYMVGKGLDPSLVRSVAYADSQPLVPPNIPGAAAKNARIEFHFHRPEVKSTVVNY